MAAVRPLLLISVWLGLSGAFLPAPARGEPAEKKIPEVVSYYHDVRPIFHQHCQGCHQPAKPQGGYVMTSHADLFKKTEHDMPGIVAGSLEKSSLMEVILPGKDGKTRMPKNKDPPVQPRCRDRAEMDRSGGQGRHASRRSR